MLESIWSCIFPILDLLSDTINCYIGLPHTFVENRERMPMILVELESTICTLQSSSEKQGTIKRNHNQSKIEDKKPLDKQFSKIHPRYPSDDIDNQDDAKTEQASPRGTLPQPIQYNIEKGADESDIQNIHNANIPQKGDEDITKAL